MLFRLRHRNIYNIMDKLSHFLLFINSLNDSFHVPKEFDPSFAQKMNKIQQSAVMRFDMYIKKNRSRFQVNIQVLQTRKKEMWGNIFSR